MTNAREWPKRRLKFAATVNDEALPETTDPDYELQYIDIGNVDSQGAVHDVAAYTFDKAPSRARRKVRHGDVIVSTVRTYLQAIAPIENPADNLIVSTGFAVIRPRPDSLEPAFCKYALRESRFLWEVQGRSVGVSYPAINASDLVHIRVSLPPVPEQNRIAAFLDAETARIDALIAEKQRMLALLDEKRQALISQAVTQGLNPDAPMKPSGQEWLGNIPAHWELLRAKWLFRERDQRSEAGEEEMLTVSHITGVTRRSEKNVNMFEAADNTGYKLCYEGDLVVNTLWAWMGAMGIAQEDGMTSPNYHVYTPTGGLLPEYVELMCRMPHFVAEVTSRSTGVWSSRLRLYPEEFLDITMAVPPHDEQRAIVKYVERKSGTFQGLRLELTRSIALLQERRSALVSAAVTGHLTGVTAS